MSMAFIDNNNILVLEKDGNVRLVSNPQLRQQPVLHISVDTRNEDGQNLINPKLVLDLPALPGPNHNGGKLAIGPDNYLYAIIGELRHNGKLQKIKGGPDPDDTGVIFRVNSTDGSAAKNNPFVNVGNEAMHRYYAYGIRNSFRIGFDPVNGNLWKTENGEKTYDEINVIKPGFNGGWKAVMGLMSRTSGVTENDLVHFPGSHYADPVFSW